MAFVVTNKYASSSAGGTSGTISIDAGVQVAVVMAKADGTQPDANVQARIQRQVNGGTTWQNEGYLTSDAPATRLVGPGLFRVIVPATPWNVIVEEQR